MTAATAAAGALVLHGLTGSPQSVQGVADALSVAGFVVRAPALPGHATTIDELDRAGWSDWVEAAEQAYEELAERSSKVVVAGLSMGGSLACHLAAGHAGDVAGLIAVNPFIDPPAESFRESVRGVIAAGFPRAPAIGGDIADPSATETAYDELPLAALLSLSEGLDGLLGRLPDIRCPVLVMTSRVDHVVPTVSSDVLAERVGGPVERAWLERSFHVATLDYDKAEIERRAVEFARKVTA